MGLRVLYLCHRLPFPPNKGEKIRAFHQLRAVAEKHEVDLFTLADPLTDLTYQSSLQRYCRQVTVAPLHRTWARVRALPSVFGSRPLTLPYFHSLALARQIKRALGTRSYDRVFVYSSSMAPYVESVDSIPIVMDLVDVDSDKWAQYARFARFPFSALYRREGKHLRQYERQICERVTGVMVSTPHEAALLQQICPAANIRVVPNGVDTGYFAPSAAERIPGAPTVIFTGTMDYFPNVDAAQFLAYGVLPLVRKSVPEVRLLIVGSHPTRNVRKLQKVAGVEVTGLVPDVRTHLARAHVFVAPLRIAAGIQNKILEAMAMELPVVTTPRAAQGLPPAVAARVETGEHPTELAEKVVRFLQDPSLARSRGRESRRRVATECEWERSLEQLLQLIEDPEGFVRGEIEPGRCVPAGTDSSLSAEPGADGFPQSIVPFPRQEDGRAHG